MKFHINGKIDGGAFAIRLGTVAMTPPSNRKGRDMGSLRRFTLDDQGADLIEYALLAGLISLACVATLTTVGGKLNTLYTSISNKIAGIVIP